MPIDDIQIKTKIVRWYSVVFQNQVPSDVFRWQKINRCVNVRMALVEAVGEQNMIGKLFLAVGIAALAISGASSGAFAKKMHKQKVAKCSMGAMCTDKPDAKGISRGWSNVKACAPNGKMYRVIFGVCYAPSGMCAKKC